MNVAVVIHRVTRNSRKWLQYMIRYKYVNQIDDDEESKFCGQNKIIGGRVDTCEYQSETKRKYVLAAGLTFKSQGVNPLTDSLRTLESD